MGLFHRSKAGVETPLEIDGIDDAAPVAQPPPAGHGGRAEPAPQADNPEIARLRAEMAERDRKINDLEARDRAREAQQQADRVAAAKAAGQTYAAGLVKANKLLPAGSRHLADLHAYAHLAAAGLPTEGLDPVAAVQGLEAGLVPHHLTAEAVAKLPAGHEVVPNGSAGSDDIAARERQASADLEAFYARQGIKPDAPR